MLLWWRSMHEPCPLHYAAFSAGTRHWRTRLRANCAISSALWMGTDRPDAPETSDGISRSGLSAHVSRQDRRSGNAPASDLPLPETQESFAAQSRRRRSGNGKSPETESSPPVDFVAASHAGHLYRMDCA